MTSKERVLAALSGKRPDSVPLNVFAGWNPGLRSEIEERHGSIERYRELLRLDVATGVLPRFPFGRPDDVDLPEEVPDFLDLTPVSSEGSTDIACDGDLFPTVNEAVAGAGERAVFAHAWGVFELSQFLFECNGRPGTEDALLNMLAEREACKELFKRLGDWTCACVDEAIRAGVDVIELSDDWGQQNTMLFSPDLWWDLVFEPTRAIVETAHASDTPVVVHSDGDITLVLDGVRELGVDGLHPVQESAGMDPARVRSALGPSVCIMGGLDTVTVMPAMTPNEIETEVERVFGHLKESGAFIFAGSHMFQDDTDLEKIERAYATALRLAPMDS